MRKWLAPGRYTIEATTFGRGDAGTYRLTVAADYTPLTPDQPSGLEVLVGDPILETWGIEPDSAQVSIVWPLALHHIADQISKLPAEIRDQLTSHGKIEGHLRRLEHIDPDIDPDIDTTPAGAYRLGWLRAFVDQDRTARRDIRRLERRIDEPLDQHGTTLRDETGIGPIAAATLVCEVGDPHRFGRESKFARWCGTGAVALSSGEGSGDPVKHRLDFRGNRRVNSVLHIASVTQARQQPDAAAYLAKKTTEGKTRREARRAHKRHLANRVIRRTWRDENTRKSTSKTAA